MTSKHLFRAIAPFPADLPTAPLYTISLAGLRSSDQTIAKNALAASQELGFFLLEHRGDGLGEEGDEGS
jgi:hypothetical protein